MMLSARNALDDKASGGVDMNRSPSDIAAEYFSKGYNCAESVLVALAEAYSVENAEVIPRIATGFGGGVGRCGEICGALSGGIMMLGLIFGRTDPDDADARSRTYPKVAELMQAFEQEFASVCCRDLTGCDMQTEEGRTDFERRSLHKELCTKLVAFAAKETNRLMTKR